MQQRPRLNVEKRSIFGKKVKKLRREGLIPANIYGADFKSTSVQLPLKDFDKVYNEVHETGLVDIVLGNETIPVLIKNVQNDPVKEIALHADFYKVNLKEKITAKIPVEAVGEAKAEVDKVGLLEQPVSEVEVEALPTELPEKIEVNVEKLAVVDEQILVSDLVVPQGVTILTDSSQVVFKIGELVTKEMEEQMAADEAAAEEAKAEEATEATEGAQEQTEEAKAEEATEATEGAQEEASKEEKA